jgi:4-hydroxy-tetrahydrodipicolinate reductase
VSAIRIAVAGANGKMGRAVIEAVRADKSLALASSFDVGDDAAKAIAAGDVVIDFTRPEGTLAHLEHCVKLARAMVIGTTGFSESQKKALADAAKRIAIVLAPNFAVGVNVVFKLAETAAGILGDDYDVEILEAHHRHKVDAPSGTALKLGEIIAGKLKRDLKKEAKHGREGDTGARPGKQIGFHAIRGGDIVGEHTVVFAGTGERVEVTVRSQSRATYALGALRAAKFLRDRKTGLFDMADVLGLK